MTLTKIENGVHMVADIRVVKTETRDGVTTESWSWFGDPHLQAYNAAIAGLYPACSLDPKPSDSGKVTLLTVNTDRDGMTDGSIVAREGTLIRFQDRPFLLKKGSRNKGWYLDRSLKVLDRAAGYNQQEKLAAGWAEKAALLGAVRPVDLDGIPEYDETAEERAVRAAFVWTHPGFGGGSTPGCIWLITDVQTDADDAGETILNGYLWTPEGGELESEHGSVVFRQLQARGGRIEHGPLTFADCWDLPTQTEQAYRAVRDGLAVTV